PALATVRFALAHNQHVISEPLVRIGGMVILFHTTAAPKNSPSVGKRQPQLRFSFIFEKLRRRLASRLNQKTEQFAVGRNRGGNRKSLSASGLYHPSDNGEHLFIDLA